MRVALVVQRYGREVAGGAELHCRLIAERLAARGHAVEVFTTRALDHVVWTQGYPGGTTSLDGIPVHRFDVVAPRDQRRLAALSNVVFNQPHGRAEEEAWVRENGPQSPALVAALGAARERFDAFVFFSFRYYHCLFGLPAVRDKALLVPTAEEDDAVELGIFTELFAMPRAIAFNTPEERQLIERVSRGRAAGGHVVGCGVEGTSGPPASLARFGLTRPYLLYLGRIEPNKGCGTLFEYYERFLHTEGPKADLVLAGKAAMPLPDDPRVHAVGYVSDSEKAALLRGCQALVMPSPYESLSLVLLEAWQEGVPVLANGRCRVLRGQCERSGGGLAYDGFEEFAESAGALLAAPALRAALGSQGRRYFEREYAWDTVMSRFEALLPA